MADEQIKQNAETAYPGFEDLQVVYIEGAHSLDEEIKELNARIIKLMCERDSIKSESEYLINKLRNPWISVEERLPKEHQDVLIENWNGLVIRNDYISIGDINYMKDNPELFPHWMETPKPELKKEE